MHTLKENWQKLSDKSKKMLMTITGVTAVVVVFAVIALKFGWQPEYSTLFTGLNQEEAQEVVSLLQEENVDYRFNDKEGAIQVTKENVDQTRARLLSQGYPKSGFTYDMYRDNAGLMTTESDKKQYTLYDLQDRLGAQIRLFEGVRDAKVTIAEAGEQKYAISDQTGADASASVVVTMESGKALTQDKAAAIKNLIARAVKGMNFTSVSVFDAETMMEIGDNSADESGLGGAKDLTALTSLIENNIGANVRRVLEKLYGQGNVAVSVKGTLNMEKLIQENTQYSTPDKIDEQDKTGLLHKEDVVNDNSLAADMSAGGVAGADANADTPRYTNNDNTQTVADNYTNSSAAREWLYNTVKEQRQVEPGVLENITVGIVINTDDMSVSQNDLVKLVANSAGIPQDAAEQNIAIVRAAASGVVRSPDTEAQPVSAQPDQALNLPLPVVIAIISGIVLLVLLILLLIIRGRGRKKAKAGDADMDGLFDLVENTVEEFVAGMSPGIADGEAAEAGVAAQDDEMRRNEEIINLRMQHSMKLKQNIGDFVDQNPQIAAKLVQSWLRGEVEDIGRKGSDTRRKEK